MNLEAFSLDKNVVKYEQLKKLVIQRHETAVDRYLIIIALFPV